MIKIGIIGTGYWGKHHIRIFSKLPCQLVGIADIDKTKESLAREYNIKFFTDFNKLLNTVDAISIVTPPSTHFDIAKKALTVGKHVFIEKPFVLKRKEALELESLRKAKNLILMVGHIFLYHPAIIELKKIIEKGDLGQIYYIISQRLNLGIVRHDVNSLWNFAPHDLSIIIYLLGKMPKEVECIGQSYLQNNLEDITFLTLKFSNKILAHIILSWLHPSKIRELTIVGSKKMAVFNDLNTNTPLTVYDKGIDRQRLGKDTQWKNFTDFKMKTRYGEIITPQVKSGEPLEFELEHFLNCIKTLSQPRSDGENGLKVITILEAATKSLKEGGKIIDIK